MKKVVITAASAALCAGFATGAFAAQPLNIAEIRCGNNGKGNGNEELQEVAYGYPKTKMECVKFIPDGGDDSPGNDIDVDPNSKP